MPALSSEEKSRLIVQVCRFIPHADLQGICLECIVFVEGCAWGESRQLPIARATGSWVKMPDLDLRQLTDAGATT
jgi:hypothetical protein